MEKTRTKAGISIFLAVIFIIGILLNPVSQLKTSAAEDYRLWRQADPRWGSIMLGNSTTETMAKSGCLVTCLAILAVHSGAEDPEEFNPGVLAEELNAIDAFSNGAIASWASITKVLPDVKFVKKYSFTSTTQSGKAAEMKAFMDEGYYMACKVNYHWVFVDSIVGDEVYMIDPAKDEVKLFEAYNNSVVSELRVFTGKNPPVNTSPAESTTTTTTTATTAPPTTEPKYAGEYINTSNASVGIYAAADKSGGAAAYLEKGQIVQAEEVVGAMGSIQLGADTCWIELDKLEYAGEADIHAQGDINNDGSIDNTDLSLLNEYLYSLSKLPSGISVLRKCEIAAADINGDGAADNSDVIAYLSYICG